MLDIYKNHCKLYVSGNYGTTDTSIVVSGANLAAKIPASGSGIFSVVWYNETDYPAVYDDPYREICRVTGFSGQTLFLERGREYTMPTLHSGDGKVHRMIATPTARGFNNLYYFRNPEKSYYYYDEFLGPVGDFNGWTTASSNGLGTAVAYSNNQQFGVWSMAPNTTAPSYRIMRRGGDAYILGSGLFVFECMWKFEHLPHSGNDFYHLVGLSDGLSEAVTADGIGIMVSSGSPNYQMYTATTSTRATVNSAVPVTTGWHKLNFVVNQIGTVADFYVDDVMIGSVSGGLPTGASNNSYLQLMTLRRTNVGSAWTAHNGTGMVDYVLIYKEIQPVTSNFGATGYNYRGN